MFLYFDYSKNAAVNMGMQFPWECTLWDSYLLPLDIYPEVGLLDHMVVLFLIFWETSILFSIMAIPIYIATIAYQGCFFFTFLTTDNEEIWSDTIT